MYKIMGKSKFGTEEIDTAENFSEAVYLVDEYTMAYGEGWEIWIEDTLSNTYDRWANC
jgi:hypothetical protein|tara:strand:- start:286 stop:459 length:174 start_codon:yes stop_codon:yes gene_type:complete